MEIIHGSIGSSAFDASFAPTDVPKGRVNTAAIFEFGKL
jgi:hypothetical protein